MNRKRLSTLLVLLVGVLALLFGDWRSDHDCIRIIVQEELPQARVLRSERHGRSFAIFFELSPADAEALSRRIPTRNGWTPLLPDACFAMSDDPEDDITGLSGTCAHVAGTYKLLPFLVRLEDGTSFAAILTTIRT